MCVLYPKHSVQFPAGKVNVWLKIQKIIQIALLGEEGMDVEPIFVVQA